MHDYMYLNIKYEKGSLQNVKTQEDRLGETFYQTPCSSSKMNRIGCKLVVNPMTIITPASRPFHLLKLAHHGDTQTQNAS